MKISYFYAEACKNTFILFDQINQSPEPLFWKKAHEILLKENRDDALILTLKRKRKKALYIKMDVLGADGKFGEFCGNGSRSVAAYLFSTYPNYKEFYLVTKRGTYPLFSLKKGIYSVHLPRVTFPKSKIESIAYGEILEPHLAIEKIASDKTLYLMGSHLNQNKSLFPDGININLWTSLNKMTIAVKTYERGVQRLTQSCGTGSCVC